MWTMVSRRTSNCEDRPERSLQPSRAEVVAGTGMEGTLSGQRRTLPEVTLRGLASGAYEREEEIC